MRYADIILSLAAGLMLEAAFGFIVPEDADAWLKVLLVVGGLGCFALALYLNHRQNVATKKLEAEARRRTEEAAKTSRETLEVVQELRDGAFGGIPKVKLPPSGSISPSKVWRFFKS